MHVILERKFSVIIKDALKKCRNISVGNNTEFDIVRKIKRIPIYPS